MRWDLGDKERDRQKVLFSISFYSTPTGMSIYLRVYLVLIFLFQ